MDAVQVLECVIRLMYAIDDPESAEFDRADNRLAEAQKYHPAEFQAAIGLIQQQIDQLGQDLSQENENV